jgi:DNA polymerase elongation subunit (family B)
MKNFAFDIETVPLDTEELRNRLPPFDPESIKTGNWGEEKRQEKIEKARLEHFERFYRKAALSALTGRIAMIGIKGETETPLILEGDEKTTIAEFLDMFQRSEAHWIGFNIGSFDVPFILRRAWLHGLNVPYGIVRNRYLSGLFTDLLELWNASERGSDRFPVSLSDLAVYFGLEAKTANGANFHEILRYRPEEARNYLINDLTLTWKIAEAMGAIRGPIPEPGPLREESSNNGAPESAAVEIQFY